MRRKRATSTSEPPPAREVIGKVIQLDLWTEPLTSRDAPKPGRYDQASNQPNWMTPPTRSGSGPVIATWVGAAMLAEPAIQAWRAEHREALSHAAATAEDAASLPDLVTEIVRGLFAAEGGAATVSRVVDECATAHLTEREQHPPASLMFYNLPDGTRLSLAASEHLPRSPVATL
jgi:hypothetical protein